MSKVKRLTSPAVAESTVEGKIPPQSTAEAIERRKAARDFNALRHAGKLGRVGNARTQQRLERLMKELREGKNDKGEELRYTDVLVYGSELISRGVSIGELRESVGSKYHLGSDPKRPAQLMLDRARRVHAANKSRIDVRVWKLFNIDPALLAAS